MSVCRHCGDELPAYAGRGRPRVFCDAKCKNDARNRSNRAKPKTAPHAIYLYALDMFNRSCDDEERRALRQIMTRAAKDAGITLHPERTDRVGDLVDTIARALTHAAR